MSEKKISTENFSERKVQKDKNTEIDDSPSKEDHSFPSPPPSSSSTDQIKKEIRSLSLHEITKQKGFQEESKEHKFWNLQPVPKMGEQVNDEGPIDDEKNVDEIRKEPYNLPEGFEWCETPIDEEKVGHEVYALLNENYVEDDDNMFRFDYSLSFLQWALKPPGFLKNWHIGVRVSKNKKLVGFITAIPATVMIHSKLLKLVEINFLCVHKKLRDRRLAPVLIKEITRRVNTQNIWQAVYTAGKVIPKPVACCRYYHRSLNPKKLIEVGFSHLGKNMTIARTIKLYKLPEEPLCKGIRALAPKDISSACKLINKYLEKFLIRPIFTEVEFAHWFLPVDGVVNSFVIEDEKTHQITDFFSFYTLPSTILGNQQHKILKAAYAYYNVATTVSLTILIKDALICAKKLGFDVYNCLDIMENETFFSDLKFGKGDGNLQYYLFNWRCPEMSAPKVGLVLL